MVCKLRAALDGQLHLVPSACIVTDSLEDTLFCGLQGKLSTLSQLMKVPNKPRHQYLLMPSPCRSYLSLLSISCKDCLTAKQNESVRRTLAYNKIAW